jgi:hypothetical protein
MAAMSTCLALAWVVLSFGTSFVVKGVEASVPGNTDVSPSLQEVLNKAHQAPLYTYPTSFTQGIIPVRSSILTNSRARIYVDNKLDLQKPIHSHNDCKSFFSILEIVE